MATGIDNNRQEKGGWMNGWTVGDAYHRIRGSSLQNHANKIPETLNPFPCLSGLLFFGILPSYDPNSDLNVGSMPPLRKNIIQTYIS